MKNYKYRRCATLHTLHFSVCLIQATLDLQLRRTGLCIDWARSPLSSPGFDIARCTFAASAASFFFFSRDLCSLGTSIWTFIRAVRYLSKVPSSKCMWQCAHCTYVNYAERLTKYRYYSWLHGSPQRNFHFASIKCALVRDIDVPCAVEKGNSPLPNLLCS